MRISDWSSDVCSSDLPELFAALEPGTRLLIDDGKLVLRVKKVEPGRIETLVEVGGRISDRKGVNVPDVVVPLAALTEKDRKDLAFRSEERRGRERVCQYGSIPVGAGALKKK